MIRYDLKPHIRPFVRRKLEMTNNDHGSWSYESRNEPRSISGIGLT